MTVAIAILAALNIGITFLFQWLPIVRLGVGPQTDALFASITVPQLLISVVATGLTAVLTPSLATASAGLLRSQVWTLIHAVGGVMAAAAGLLALSAGVWVGWTVPGFDADARALTAGLLHIHLAGLVLASVLQILWSACYAQQQFVRVEASNVVSGVIGLAVLWVALPVFGVRAAAAALVLRTAIQLAMLVSAIGPYRRLDWGTLDCRTLGRRLTPLLTGSLYSKADPIVERLLASFTPAGHLSILHLAQQGWAAANQVLNRAWANPMLPALSRLAETGAGRAFDAMWTRRLVHVLAAAAISSLAVIWPGRLVLSAVLPPWAFTPGQVELLHLTLVAYLGLWIAGAAGQILTMAFYARGNTWTPTAVGVVGFTLGIPLKVWWGWWWGVVGIAAATSVYVSLNAVMHYLLLRRESPSGQPSAYGKIFP